MDSAVKVCLLSCLLSLATAQWGPCPYKDSYCEITDGESDVFVPAGVDQASTVDEVAALCYAECNTQALTCEGFTVFKTGNWPPTCHLLREPCSVNLVDACIERGNCQSGPKDCNDLPVTCPVLPPLSDDKVRWQCTDIATNTINPYTEEPPVGTLCYQMCPSWISADETTVARLESTCEGTGAWSETQNYDNTELFWPKYISGASYPTPDAADGDALGCGCPDLALVWPYEGNDPAVGAAMYDPNAEDAAEFICETAVNADNAFTITTGNTCVLFCDDHYVATATCLNGEWSGNPQWGFWCYDEPNQ